LDELLDGPDKLECFVRFDEVNYSLSRTRDLITHAETYSYWAFHESFRELRREARISEVSLISALYDFDKAMKGETNGSEQGQ